MNRSRSVLHTLALVILSVFLSANAVFGYGGPGSVVTGIGALFAAVAALLAALFGFVWFPLKKLIGMFKSDPPDETTKVEGS